MPSLWISVAVLALSLVMSLVSDAFATPENLFNVTRNFAFIAIIADRLTHEIAQFDLL